jgi:glycosyltransferase involved in cell wall biosynthesis
MKPATDLRVALLYNDNAYVEAGGGGAAGLMGRQVAGQSFLDAYLSHGSFSELAALVQTRASAESLEQRWRAHAPTSARSRTLSVIEQREFYHAFCPAPPATIVHAPQPPDAALAWTRQQLGRHAYALSGVTHTLCSLEAMELLRALVTAPFESYDALICTSRAVADMVREVTSAYAEHLGDRLGMTAVHQPARPLKVRLEMIPLGVDVDRYHPPSPAERSSARRLLGSADDEVVILYVGRLSHHAKAQPFPMFKGIAEAARSTSRRVHLVLAGWAAHPAVHEAFVAGARAFAPDVRTSLVDGRDPQVRHSVWHAADLFVSPSDNIQETFGLSVLEAMACGLPVVASDWDGYRDLVVHGESGFLIPTSMVVGATASTTTRLMVGELTYDHFLAECSQATTVDVATMASAAKRLIADPALARRMGEAGRRRARERFAWPQIIRAVEQLWREQEQERSERARSESRKAPPWAPAAYPAPERSFAAYPTRRLDGSDRVIPAPGSAEALETLLATPLTHHAAGHRVQDASLIRRALEAAPCSIDDLDRLWADAGMGREIGRSTLAWLLKYDLLRAVYDGRLEGKANEENPA